MELRLPEENTALPPSPATRQMPNWSTTTTTSQGLKYPTQSRNSNHSGSIFFLASTCHCTHLRSNSFDSPLSVAKVISPTFSLHFMSTENNFEAPRHSRSTLLLADPHISSFLLTARQLESNDLFTAVLMISSFRSMANQWLLPVKTKDKLSLFQEIFITCAHFCVVLELVVKKIVAKHHPSLKI